MVKAEILTMPAGIDMDRLIMRLMPWPELDKAINYDARLGTAWANQDDGIWKFEPGLAHLWTPSAEIHDAWDVVEQFYSMKLDKYSGGGEWRVYLVTQRYDKNVDANAIADTAPLAICRAA